jgi:hypothetical protein
MPSTNDIKLFFDDISQFLCKNAEYKIDNNTVWNDMVIFELLVFVELTDDNKIILGVDGYLPTLYIEKLKNIFNEKHLNNEFFSELVYDEDNSRLYKYYNVMHDTKSDQYIAEQVYLRNCVHFLEKKIDALILDEDITKELDKEYESKRKYRENRKKGIIEEV